MIKLFFLFSEDNNSFGVNKVVNILAQELKKYCSINNKFSALEFIKSKKNIIHSLKNLLRKNLHGFYFKNLLSTNLT